MAFGLIGAAMAGGGKGASDVIEIGARYAVSSKLQAEAAEIARMRDERLAEIRKGEIEFAEDLRRKPAREAAAEIEKAKTEHVDDLSGTARPRTRSEMVDVEESAYRKQGLVTEAQGVRQTEMQRERDVDARLGRTRDDNRGEAQLEELKRHNAAVEKLQAAQEGRLKKASDTEDAIKQLALNNAKRVEDLRKEFVSADVTQERKRAIGEEIQLLTGKDNDWYLPVPIKDETGAITGYQIFDRRRGVWVQPGGDGGGAGSPSAADIEGLIQRAGNPAAIEFFEKKYGKGSAARFLKKPKPKLPGDRIVPSTPPNGVEFSDREFEGDEHETPRR